MSFEPLKPRAGKDFSLEYPFKLGGQEYTTLSLRRPTRGDVVAMADGKGQPGALMDKFIANLAGVGTDVISCLDPADSAVITAWLEPILDPNGLASPGSGS